MSAPSLEPSELSDPEELDFWSFARFAKRGFEELWPGIDSAASFFVMTLHRATDVILFDVRQIDNDFGLSPSGQRALYVLSICGPLSMLRLAELAGMSKASCSSSVRTLAAEGYVMRTRDEKDGRSYIVSLTDAGDAAAQQTFRERNLRESRWLNALSKNEAKELHRIFGKLMAFADENAKRRDSI